ncbi:MAG: hypothetical protein H6719_07990 [Sandaracinaceae bacterium]|nr:hypothetical protein [Sandaracinaceae bacterium]
MGKLARIALLCSVLGGCGADDDDTPPPPVEVVAEPAPAEATVTVNATSMPPGAAVTGGGRALGTTPLTVQVPVPPTVPGQPAATYAFTFTLDGYTPTTLEATPVNGAISLAAALAPATEAPTPAPAGGQTTAGSILGTWVGLVRQAGYPPYPITMTIDRVSGDGVCGRVDYRTLHCGGELRCLGPRGSNTSFRETLTRRGECVDGGRIDVHVTGDRLAWQWYFPNGRPDARTTLSRAP